MPDLMPAVYRGATARAAKDQTSQAAPVMRSRQIRRNALAFPAAEMMNAPAPYVAIVDDDASVRKALARLLFASAFDARTYASAQQFLTSLGHAIPQCLIVDLQMPEMTGLELHSELVRHRNSHDHHHGP